jgi:broad specificity phosphatase PhoE
VTPEFLLNLAAIAAGAAGVYAAIRADLTRAIVTAEMAAKAADQAHGRLDSHIETHH